MRFNEALTTLKVSQLAQEAEQAAISELLERVTRYHAALTYYAADKNYIDGSPMLGDFEREDQGWTARRALQLDDYKGAPMIVIPTPTEEAPVAA